MSQSTNMFDLEMFSLENISKQDTWVKVLATAGAVAGVYGIYKFIANRRFVHDLNKKCVLITGCDSGFGHALALSLDQKGCPVFAACLTKNGATELKAKASSRLQTCLLDVTSSESIRNAFQFVKTHLPEDTVFWGVVNNAGISGRGGPVEFLPRSEYEKVMQVNFIGQTEVISTFLPLLKKSRGRIVNVASIAAKLPSPGHTPYVASKYAVDGYSKALRREKKIWGINVSTIMPGLYKTGIIDMDRFNLQLEEQWKNLPEELREEYGEGYFKSVLDATEKFCQKAKLNITPVISSMEHALFAMKPKDNYVVGLDAKIIGFLESLPIGIVERLQVSYSPRPDILKGGK